MSDLKKKFLDILFEPEEEAALEKMREEDPIEKVNDKSPFKASDVLYHKSPNTFINYKESKKPEKEEPFASRSEYELSSNISPIYGVMNKDPERKETKKEVSERQVRKPANDYLEIIPSPIYGYGYKEDELKEDMADNSVKEMPDVANEEEMHRLFSESDKERSVSVEETVSLFDIFGDNG